MNTPRTHVLRTGTLRVSASVDSAFELFTPLGEKLWAAGWDPEFHHPADGAPIVGSVFSTRGLTGDVTHWILIDRDLPEHRARYARVTPGLRAGTVEVRCTPIGATATEVQVTYDLTALNEVGDADLATWTEPWFDGFLAEWQKAIADAIATAA